MGISYCGCAIRLLPSQMNRHGRTERSVLPATPQGVSCLIGPGKRVGHGGQFPQLRREGLTRIGIKAGGGLGPGQLRIPLGKVDDRFARPSWARRTTTVPAATTWPTSAGTSMMTPSASALRTA